MHRKESLILNLGAQTTATSEEKASYKKLLDKMGVKPMIQAPKAAKNTKFTWENTFAEQSKWNVWLKDNVYQVLNKRITEPKKDIRKPTLFERLFLCSTPAFTTVDRNKAKKLKITPI